MSSSLATIMAHHYQLGQPVVIACGRLYADAWTRASKTSNPNDGQRSNQYLFRLYKGSLTPHVWEETHPSVVTKNGLFNVVLGTIVNMEDVSWHDDYDFELGIKVGADAETKVPFTSVPYALATRGFRYEWTGRSDDVVDNFQYAPNVIIGHENNRADGVGGATIGGGGYMTNTSPPTWNEVSGSFGTVAGGAGNFAGYYGTVSGGELNSAGDHSAVPGGSFNEASGEHSYAAGYTSRATHDGAFVWRDLSDATGNEELDKFVSTGDNQFLIHAGGGVAIGTNAPGAALHVKGNGNQSPDQDGIIVEHWDTSNYWHLFMDDVGDFNFGHNARIYTGFIDDATGYYYPQTPHTHDPPGKTSTTLMDGVSERVARLNPRTYQFLDSGRSVVGFDPDEMAQHFPEVVTEKNGETAIAYGQLSVVAIKALQEQQEMIEHLQREIQQLRAEVARR